MNCRNCAAPMELFDRRRYYFCRYCGTFEFLDAARSDGVHVLERKADALPCPLCAAPLAKSLLDDAHVIEHCEKCRGVLVERAVFAMAVSGRRARAAGPGVPLAEIDRREFHRRVTCSRCRTTMDVHPYYGPGNVVIDTCQKCDLVWLDFGELRQIADAPGWTAAVRHQSSRRRISIRQRRREFRRSISSTASRFSTAAGPWSACCSTYSTAADNARYPRPRPDFFFFPIQSLYISARPSM